MRRKSAVPLLPPDADASSVSGTDPVPTKGATANPFVQFLLSTSYSCLAGLMAPLVPPASLEPSYALRLLVNQTSGDEIKMTDIVLSSTFKFTVEPDIMVFGELSLFSIPVLVSLVAQTVTVTH